jgi:hypothetical protein
MRALKLTYLLPLVISLTTAPEGCASLGLLSQSIVIVTKALMRLRDKARANISGFGPMLRHWIRPARALVLYAGCAVDELAPHTACSHTEKLT